MALQSDALMSEEPDCCFRAFNLLLECSLLVGSMSKVSIPSTTFSAIECDNEVKNQRHRGWSGVAQGSLVLVEVVIVTDSCVRSGHHGKMNRPSPESNHPMPHGTLAKHRQIMHQFFFFCHKERAHAYMVALHIAEAMNTTWCPVTSTMLASSGSLSEGSPSLRWPIDAGLAWDRGT